METLTGPREALDKRAAALLAEHILSAARLAPHVVLGVVGGRSVGGIYRELLATDAPWSKVYLFLADERLVPPTHADSNYRLIHGDLLEPLFARGALRSEQAPSFPLDEGRADCGLADYNRTFRALGGGFHAVLLSAGEDGHAASLFPAHPSVRDDACEFILVDDAPKPPPRRVSASRTLLERAQLGVLLFYGDEKRHALDRFRDPSIDVFACPAKVVSQMQRAWVLSDVA